MLLQEIKKIVKSIPYLIFVAAIIIGLFSQGVFRFGDDLLQEPQPGSSYGFKQGGNSRTDYAEACAERFVDEFSNNNYTTYPIRDLSKHVKLSERRAGKNSRNPFWDYRK